MATITIPKKLMKYGNLMVIDRKSFEKMSKENVELRLAIKAIMEGELALRQGKTRSFKVFLKSKFPRYAKNY